jgi:hypothetical protein
VEGGGGGFGGFGSVGGGGGFGGAGFGGVLAGFGGASFGGDAVVAFFAWVVVWAGASLRLAVKAMASTTPDENIVRLVFLRSMACLQTTAFRISLKRTKARREFHTSSQISFLR